MLLNMNINLHVLTVRLFIYLYINLKKITIIMKPLHSSNRSKSKMLESIQ